MTEKQRREAAEKALNDEQAVIWRTDKENYELEEEPRRREFVESEDDQVDDYRVRPHHDRYRDLDYEREGYEQHYHVPEPYEVDDYYEKPSD